nr:MAG TPA: hypothetical protein [Caudoviricetes sp.]
MTEKYIEEYGGFNVTIKAKDDEQKQHDEKMIREVLHRLLGISPSNDESIDIRYNYETTDKNTY